MVTRSHPGLLIFHGREGTLEIEVGEGGWSDCWFTTDQRIFLGSEDAAHLLIRLLDRVIDDKGVEAGQIDKLPVKWVLTFSITYSRFYVAYENEERVLFFLSLQTDLIGAIRLGSHELERWRTAIESQLSMIK